MGNTLMNVAARFLVILLIMSFAVWGIGDVFRGNTSNVVATVGDVDIGLADFQDAVRGETNRLRQLYGNNLPTEALNSLQKQVEQSTLSGLVNRTLLANAANDMGITVGDKMVINQIRDFSAFQDESGRFSKEQFKQFLRHKGESKKHFLQSLRAESAIDFMINTISVQPIISSQMVKKIAIFEDETRMVDILTIPANHIKNVPEPSESALIQFFDEEKEQFNAPEFRTISYITIHRDDANKNISVTDAMVQRAFDDQYSGQERPEMRNLQQIMVQDEKKANKIHKALIKKSDKKGAIQNNQFTKIAKKKAKIEKDALNFGEVTHDSLKAGLLPDETVAKIFTLEKNHFTEPVETDLGWHIFRVTDITPAGAYNIDNVATDLRTQLREEQEDEALYTLTNNVEDELAGGSTLEETASLLELTVKKIGAVNRDGKGQQNTPIKNIPAFDGFLPTAFDTATGEASQLLTDRKNDIYYIIRTDSVIPPRQKALDEVRGKVIMAWKKKKKIEMLKELANTNAENIRVKVAGLSFSLEDAAKKLGVKITKNIRLKRPDVEPTAKIPTALANNIFAIKKGTVTNAHRNSEGGYVIARLSSATIPSADELSETKKKIHKRMQEEFSNDMMQQYVRFLQSQYPIEVFLPKKAAN